MDTHIPNISGDEAPSQSFPRPPASLPGAHASSQAAAPADGVQQPLQPVVRARQQRRGRTVLFATVSVAGLAAAAAAFLLSPYNHVIPVDTARLEHQARQFAASVGLQPAVPSLPIVAPAARLAGNAPAPVNGPLYRDKTAPSEPGTEADEIRGFYTGGAGKRASGGDAPAAKPSPAAVRLVEKPASTLSASLDQPSNPIDEVGLNAPVPAPGNQLVPSRREATVQAEQADPIVAQTRVTTPVQGESAAKDLAIAPAGGPSSAASSDSASTDKHTTVNPAGTPPAEVKNQAAASADPVRVNPQSSAKPSETRPAAAKTEAKLASDPVIAAITVRAGPMASGEEVEVLSLVTQLATVVRDLKAENAGLSAAVKASSDKVEAAVADVNRRLSMAEAHAAVYAATAVEAPVGHAPSTPQTARAQLASALPAASGPHRYKLQAASPGLALLAELDHGGAEGAGLQVQVGDLVPGYGRVTSIQQQGASWVVSTDRGAIQ